MLKGVSIITVHRGWGRRLTRYCSQWFLAGLVLVAKQGAAEQPHSNLELLRLLVAEAARQVVKEAQAPELRLRPLRPRHQANWLVEQELVHAAQGQGVQVFVAPEGAETPGVEAHTEACTLDFAVLTIGVRYHAPQGGPFRAKRVTRMAFVQLRCQVIEPDGRVRWSRDFEQRAEDTIPLRMVERLEDPEVSFARGDLPRARGLSRVWEPALVIVVTGVVTYLFYAYRSR